MLTDKGLCYTYNAESMANLFDKTEYMQLLTDSLGEKKNGLVLTVNYNRLFSHFNETS